MDQLIFLALLIAASVFALNRFKKHAPRQEETDRTREEEQGEE